MSIRNATVEAIFVHVVKARPMEPRLEVQARAGEGIEGDVYCLTHPERAGSKVGPDREITLIEAEALEALRRDYDVPFGASESRRNLLTRGLSLNHLVGREFRVGGATLRGIRLCEPCDHLESLTRPGVRNGLVHRGGLRAQILQSGVIRVGDEITPFA